MKLPFFVAIKDFFGFYAITPFEQSLLERLVEALDPKDQYILTSQLRRFTLVQRVINSSSIDDPDIFGGNTMFFTQRWGKDVSKNRQTVRFDCNISLLATAHVIFNDGEINVKFWTYGGVLSSIQYRSPQKIYYPGNYFHIDSLRVWPRYLNLQGKECIPIEQARTMVDNYVLNRKDKYKYHVVLADGSVVFPENIGQATKEFFSKFNTITAYSGNMSVSASNIGRSKYIQGFIVIGYCGSWEIVQRQNDDEVFVIEDESIYDIYDGRLDYFGYPSIYHLVLDEIQQITPNYP
jgi:hypothetical protein